MNSMAKSLKKHEPEATWDPVAVRSQHDDVPGFSDALEEWPQQRIYGDFYREPVEDVTRGGWVLKSKPFVRWIISKETWSP